VRRRLVPSVLVVANPLATEYQRLTDDEQHRIKYRGVNMNLIGNPRSIIPGVEPKVIWTATNK